MVASVVSCSPRQRKFVHKEYMLLSVDQKEKDPKTNNMNEQATARKGTVGKLLTIGEVSERLRVPKSWIYDQRSKGTLPFSVVRIGGGNGRLRFPQPDLEAYLERQTERG